MSRSLFVPTGEAVLVAEGKVCLFVHNLLGSGFCFRVRLRRRRADRLGFHASLLSPVAALTPSESSCWPSQS